MILEGRWTSKRESFGVEQAPMKNTGMTSKILSLSNVLFNLCISKLGIINSVKVFVIKLQVQFLGAELSA